MKTENVAALSFLVGGLFGIAVITLAVLHSLPLNDEPKFSYFPDTCIVNDLGDTRFQVYCPDVDNSVAATNGAVQ
jgi:hypothetical protein